MDVQFGGCYVQWIISSPPTLVGSLDNELQRVYEAGSGDERMRDVSMVDSEWMSQMRTECDKVHRQFSIEMGKHIAPPIEINGHSSRLFPRQVGESRATPQSP